MSKKRKVQTHSIFHRLTAILMAFAMMIGGMVFTPARAQAEDTSEYEIYPSPHVVEYTDGSYIMKEKVNVVYESAIDDDTKARLNEILSLKDDITDVSESDKIVEGKTNILVGVKDSGEFVDSYAKENLQVETEGLYDKLDSYVLESKDGVITVLGENTDSSFYGLTTLYHIVKQMDSYTIRNFHIEDWSDVASRGFIEGYYGNPWSTEDRMNLMTWGGYYKLNSYFYAPKDDPKHNSKWRELYTDEEIEEKIKPLAEAGNASKCRFVFALHPFMNSPISFSSMDAYQADMEILQAKFEQVIKAGVRQIAILADDAANFNNTGNLGGNNYKRVLEDMSAWLVEMQKTYPDLKLTLPFCPVEYGGYGEAYYSDFPDNVQVIMTGGRVWGEVSNNFTNTFTNNVGRGPYMWINWPCTDNSKKHLIMGGYKTFLQTGVEPSKIQGIVLNPMQQSEPSKVAIFGNACYSWNIWETEEEADATWNASFKYVDHNSAVATEASDALKELSKHMINQAMDSRVTALEESVELSPKLDDFEEKLNAGTVTEEDVDALIAEFEVLQNAADVYEKQAGDTNVRDQIVYWLNCWDDTTDAAIAYLNGVKAVLNNDTTNILKYNTEGKTAFDNSKSYGFHYVDHTEYAEVGVQHIVPFINAVGQYVSQYAETAMDPSKVITSFVTSRKDNPVNGTDKAIDGDDATFVSYQNPVWIKKGEYVGITYNKVVDVNDIRFLLGNGKNHFESSKLQYTMDGKEWTDLTLTGMDNAFTGVQGSYLEVVVTKENLPEDFQARGIRLIATADNTKDAYLNVHEIQINKQESEQPGQPIQYNVMKTDRWKIYQGAEALLNDGNDSTFVWYDPDGDANTTNDDFMVDDFLGYDLGKVAKLESTHIVVGAGDGDKIVKYAIETSVDNINWTAVDGYAQYTGAESGKDVLDIALNGIEARYIRIRNLEQKGSWGKFSEFTVVEDTSGGSSENLYTDVKTDVLAHSEEGEISLTQGNVTLNKGNYIGIDLKHIKRLTSIETSELPENTVLETSTNGVVWTTYDSKESVDARYVRVKSDADSVTWKVDQFEVSYVFVGEKTVESDFDNQQSSDDMRTAGTVNNVFDGDLSTIGMINGGQTQGKHITFDLGQTIHFESIRYYIVETQLNYLRHAAFEVSVDGEQWTKVLEVGQETENAWDDTVAKDMQDITLLHDNKNPGYMYAEATGLDVDGRYIRVTPITSYDYRWTAFNEIQINGGAYFSPESNRDIISEAVEEEGKIPSNMLDGDYSTVYKSSEANSSFTYRLSAPEGVTSIRLIQLGSVSNAVVTAKYIGEEKTISLGKLNQAINEFKVPDGKLLESITVTWKDIIPEIAEIATSSEAGKAVDKTELEKALQDMDTSAWTTDSVKAYEEAKDIAREVYENANVTQSVVDSALGALQSAISSAEMKAVNIEELQKLVEEKVSNEDNIYSNSTYASYVSAVNKLAAALENADNLSQTEADSLKAAVENAKASLEYSIRNRELAEIATEAYALIIGENYTTASYAALTDAKTAIDTLVQQDKAAEAGEGERINPQEFLDAKTVFEDALEGLVDVTILKAEIAKFATVDGSQYTQTSFDAYSAAVNAGKVLLENGTVQQVADAAADIQAKFAALELKPDRTLEEVIAQARALNGENYTEDSYNALMDVVAEAEENAGTDDGRYIAEIDKAMKELVNVEALKAQLMAGNNVVAEKYTVSSYKVLKMLMDETTTLLKSGTQSQVNERVSKIDSAIRKLEVRAEGVNEYRSNIKLKPTKGYTEESYNAYKAAYEALMKADAQDLSAEEFAKLKADFEKAELALKFIQENNNHNNGNNNQNNQNGNGVHTGDTINVVPVVVVLVICAAIVAAIIVFKKKNLWTLKMK